MFPGAEGFCLGLLQTVGFRRRPLAPCCAGASWVYAGRFVPCGEPTKAPYLAAREFKTELWGLPWGSSG